MSIWFGIKTGCDNEGAVAVPRARHGVGELDLGDGRGRGSPQRHGSGLRIRGHHHTHPFLSEFAPSAKR
jgi:hypothetical protein